MTAASLVIVWLTKAKIHDHFKHTLDRNVLLNPYDDLFGLLDAVPVETESKRMNKTDKGKRTLGYDT